MHLISNLAIIQVRTGSSRLPNKCFKKLGKYRIIDWVIKRVKKSKLIDKIVLATSTKKKDSVFKLIAKKNNIEFFFGDEQNVLLRFHKVIKKFNPKNVIRVCADNPFVSSSFLDKLITFYKNNKCDLAFNNSPNKDFNYNCIDGLGAEIFNYKLIESALKNTKSKKNLEHVTRFFYLNKRFKIKPVPLKKIFYMKTKSLDVNTSKDLNYLKSLVKKHDFNINSGPEKIAYKLSVNKIII